MSLIKIVERQGILHIVSRKVIKTRGFFKNSKQMRTDSNTYYNAIAPSYSNLHKDEQTKKLEFIWEKINDNISTSETILDVGCGTGISTHFFAEKGFQIIGIDPAIELLNNKVTDKQLIKAPAENIPFEDNSFDIVISLTAIQNFSDVKKGLTEIKRVGKAKFMLTFLAENKRELELQNSIKEVFPEHKHFIERDNIFLIGF